MPEQTRRAVLVGFDGSMSLRLAAAWAAREAARADRPLWLVHTFRWPLPELAELRMLSGVIDEVRARKAASVLLDGAVARCRALAPGIEVRGRLLTGNTVEALATLATEAELLVLGASGQSGIARVLLGSSAAELARGVPSSVVIVRDVHDGPAAGHTGAPTRGRVVVGVDGSPASEHVLRFGFDFAARHDRELVAVHAWCDLPLDAVAAALPADLDRAQVHKEADAVLERLLVGARGCHPEVPVRHVVSLDRPTQALLDEAAGAALLVVGRHGRAHGDEAPLGSVSHAVLHYARCPVAVVGTQ